MNGQVNYLVDADSLSNLEKALGFRFGEETDEPTAEQDSSLLALTLNSLKIRNLSIHYISLPDSVDINLKINGLESNFDYQPAYIDAAVMLHADLLSANIKDISLDKTRSVSFSTSVNYDQQLKTVLLDRSLMDLNDILLELEGEANFASGTLDLNFLAKNRGIDLLNFLMNGVLDMEDLEQTGNGSINLSGDIFGSFKDNIPEVNVWFDASDLGFMIHSLNQSVSNIGFSGYFTNGKKSDFSEAEFSLENLHLDYPKGEVDADVQVSNLRKPRVNLKLKGETDLSVLNELLKSGSLKDLEGMLSLDGEINGVIDKKSSHFLEDAGTISLAMDGVGFVAEGHAIDSLSGIIVINEDVVELTNLKLIADSSSLSLDGRINSLLPYLLGFEVDPVVDLALSSPELYYSRLMGDSVDSPPIRDLNLDLEVSITGKELDRLLDSGDIPDLKLQMNNFSALVPGYAPVSGRNLQVRLDGESVYLEGVDAEVAGSNIELGGYVLNYKHFLEKDSASSVKAFLSIQSSELAMRDLFTINDTFRILPMELEEEKLSGFSFRASLETTVYELLSDKEIPDVRLNISQLRSNFSIYPNRIHNFRAGVELRDSLIIFKNVGGKIGNSDIELDAELVNLLDTSKVFSGKARINSRVLDLNELMVTNYTSPKKPDAEIKQAEEEGTALLSDLDVPAFRLALDVGEIRYEENRIFKTVGRLRAHPARVLYLDTLSLNTWTGGHILAEGQFVFSDPEVYTFSSRLVIDSLSTSDYNLPISLGDTIVDLEDHFSGKLNARGLGEFFIYPDYTIDLEKSTAFLYAGLLDGRVRDFAPLNALARATGNTELHNLKFGKLENPRGFTLSDGMVSIPLMQISTDVGSILIEGEQELSGDFLYLLRLPPALIRNSAWNILTGPGADDDTEGQIQDVKTQKLWMVTVSGKDGETEIKNGDKRDKYR